MQLSTLRSIWLCLSVLTFAQIETIIADDGLMKQNSTSASKGNASDMGVSLDTKTLVDPLMKFSCNLFSKTKEANRNTILSPLSVHQALNLLLLGSDQNSATQIELIKALGYPSSSVSIEEQAKYHEAYSKILDTVRKVTTAEVAKQRAIEEKRRHGGPNIRSNKPMEPIIDFWNMIIAKNEAKLNAHYSARIKKYYNSSIEQVSDSNSEANKLKKSEIIGNVNKWAKEAGFEADLMRPTELNDNFRALLLTAVRVQACWFKRFYLADGKNIFYNYGSMNQLVSHGKVLQATELIDSSYLEFRPTDDLVEHKNLHAKLVAGHVDLVKTLNGLNFHTICVRLVGGIEFIIIEPLTKGSGHELRELVDELVKLDSNGQSKLTTVLQLVDSPESRTIIDGLEFPAFKFNNDLALKESLKQIGIRRAFNQDQAELSSITTDKLYVSEAKHQAMIEVNQFGLKGAALTSIRIGLKSLRIVKEPIMLRIKSPFMFVVRYAQLPLFIGQLVLV